MNVPAIPTSDPLGLLWRLRTAPPDPGKTEVLHLLDGLTLWRVQITAGTARDILPDGNRTAIRLEGQLAPIFFDGRPDPDRPSRRFTLWLSDASDHLPLRLEVPLGLADVVMTLAEERDLAPVATDYRRPSADGAGAGRAQLVADVAHRFDHGASRTQFGAQATHVNVHRARTARHSDSPTPGTGAAPG